MDTLKIYKKSISLGQYYKLLTGATLQPDGTITLYGHMSKRGGNQAYVYIAKELGVEVLAPAVITKENPYYEEIFKKMID